MSVARECATSAPLQRRIVELEEELAEWKAWARAWASDEEMAARRSVIRRALQLQPQAAQMLIALVDHAPRMIHRDRLLQIVSRDEEVQPKIVAVYACKIRAALKAAALTGKLELIWGQGYQFSRDAAHEIAVFLERDIPECDIPEGPPLSPYERRVLRRMTPGSAAVVLGRDPAWVGEQRAALGLGG